MIVISDVKCDTKYDKIIQNSSQEPSMSSRYDYDLDAFIILLGSWKFEYNSVMTNNVDSWCKIWYQRQSNPRIHQPGTINVLQVCLCSWSTYNHARELKIWIQLKNEYICWFRLSTLVSNMFQSSKTLVRNHQRPPHMIIFLIHL